MCGRCRRRNRVPPFAPRPSADAEGGGWRVSAPFNCRGSGPISRVHRTGTRRIMPDRLTPAFRARRHVAAAAAGCGRAGPRGAALGRGAAHVLRADRQARGAGGRHRVGRQDHGEPQSADGRPVLPALLRAAVRRAARADPAVARLRRHRRSVRPDRHQQPRHRRRRPGQDFARRQARVRRRCRAQGSPRRSRGAARQGRQQGALPGDRRSAIPTSCRSATWCWRSAIRSASARP